MISQQPVVASHNSIETISVWALVVTLAVAALIFFPFSMSLITVKTFVLVAGMLVTLALYILARLSRGNIIFPPLMLVGALWSAGSRLYSLSGVFRSFVYQLYCGDSPLSRTHSDLFSQLLF